MSATLQLVRISVLSRLRIQRHLQLMNLGVVGLIVLTMFQMTRALADQGSLAPEMIEYTAWRILIALTFTVFAIGLSGSGSTSQREFLQTIGVREAAYVWSRWGDIACSTLPWLLWSLTWSIATAGASEVGFATLVLFSCTLYLYALFAGGTLGIAFESALQRVRNGPNIARGLAMIAPFIMLSAMLGYGREMQMPVFLHNSAFLTPMGALRYLLNGDSAQPIAAILMALVTVIPWVLAMCGISLYWTFRTDSGSGVGRYNHRNGGASFRATPFIAKDILMLRRNGITLFRGVLAAGVLLLPFMFLNTSAEIPLFIRFFQVLIVVAVSGMVFGLVLPALDREVLWLIRITGQLPSYVVQKFVLVAAITAGFSAILVSPLCITLRLPLVVVGLLIAVAVVLMSSLTLIASALALRWDLNMADRPDANLVLGIMFAFGFFLSTVVMGYLTSWVVFLGFLAVWALLSFVGLGVALYLFQTQDTV